MSIIAVVGNKIHSQSEKQFLVSSLPGFEFLGFVPYDQALVDADLANLPLLYIHARGDDVVPFPAGMALYNQFPGGDKTLWAIPTAGHINLFAGGGGPLGNQLLQYLEEKIPPHPPPGYRWK